MELQPANTIRSAAALGMVILFMVSLRNGEGERERCAGQGWLGDVPSQWEVVVRGLLAQFG